MGLADSFMFLNKTHSLCVLCLILSSLRVPGVFLVFCPFFVFFFFFFFYVGKNIFLEIYFDGLVV
jgi:hypothetical protein